jgi:hypothetical protein
MAQSQSRQGISTYLTLEQFEEFVLPTCTLLVLTDFVEYYCS